MSKLLLNEEPLLIMPKLATKIGLNESIILQQFHYWVLLNEKVKNNFHDDYYWTYNTYKEWQEQFPFWSIKTIQRTIKNLQDMKLVIVGNYNKLKIDRTKWYRIDYNALEILENSPFGQIDLTNRTEWLHHLDSLTNPLPEITTEITSKTNKEGFMQNEIREGTKSTPNNSILFFDYLAVLLKRCKTDYREEILESIIYYYSKYKEVLGEEHIRYKEETCIEVITRLDTLYSLGIEDENLETFHSDIDLESFKAMVDKHFEINYKKMQYTLLSFLNDKVLKNRFYEACY